MSDEGIPAAEWPAAGGAATGAQQAGIAHLQIIGDQQAGRMAAPDWMPERHLPGRGIPEQRMAPGMAPAEAAPARLAYVPLPSAGGQRRELGLRVRRELGLRVAKLAATLRAWRRSPNSARLRSLAAVACGPGPRWRVTVSD